ncbi:MAG: flagellar export chaperone FliS [Chloroflexi bacterium]|nr:flagellar export chaperone FliS [Chloroflexota bacterium]
MVSNGYQQYRTSSVETAKPVDLVVMLNQGVVRFSQRAVQAIERRDLEAAHQNLVKAQAIVAELASTLNLEAGGPIAQNLLSIYDYAHRRLVEANCRKSAAPAVEVAQLFRELLSAWQQLAEASSRDLASSGAGR